MEGCVIHMGVILSWETRTSADTSHSKRALFDGSWHRDHDEAHRFFTTQAQHNNAVSLVICVKRKLNRNHAARVNSDKAWHLVFAEYSKRAQEEFTEELKIGGWVAEPSVNRLDVEMMLTDKGKEIFS